ncbi:MAG TPA: BON domain-containing protein [Bryobacteraceae bacterium]|nr:BON domain-containing protein [Bryobacteraceae bacterium]
MARSLAAVLCLICLMLFSSCSQSDQETARQREAEAKAKAHEAAGRLSQDAKKLGREVKQDARSASEKIGNALNRPGSSSNGASQAEHKIARGGRDLRIETDKAGVKLGHAAIIAKVKAKLATDVGLSTVTGVDVDASGQIVTLRGTVDSVQQKQQAEKAAMQVNGITKVIDDLQVRP